MKSGDFITSKVIVETHMERDHEVQMARSQLYFAAKAAIELHGLLQHITEDQGLEGWVQSKITKAADYLQAVHHHLLYVEKQEEQRPPEFELGSAELAFEQALGEMSAGGTGAGGIAIGGTSMPGPKAPNPFKKHKKVKEAAPAANVSAPAGSTTTAAPAAGTTPPKPGAPVPPAAPGQPAKPGVPAGTMTPPNPAQIKKDTDTLTSVLNNPVHPMNAQLQALIKKAATIPH